MLAALAPSSLAPPSSLLNAFRSATQRRSLYAGGVSSQCHTHPLVADAVRQGEAAHKASVINPDESNELPVRPSERQLPPLYWMVGRLTGGAVFTATDPDALLRTLVAGYTIAYGTDGAANMQQRLDRVNAIYRVATTAQNTVITKLKTTGEFRALPGAVQAELLRNKTEAPGQIIEVWESTWPLLLLHDEVTPARLRRRKHPSVKVLNGRTDMSFLSSLRSVGLIAEWGVI